LSLKNARWIKTYKISEWQVRVKYLNTSFDLKNTISRLDSLPAMPVIAQKLLALDLGTDEGEAALLTLIGLDGLISAKIIGLANTSQFGSRSKVATIKDAATRLGLNRVKSVAIGIATMTIQNTFPKGEINADDIWLNGVGIAFAMGVIAKEMPSRIRPKEDQIFLAGLLHDIGYMALAFLDTKASDELYIQLQIQATCPVVEIENELIGLTHCEIGEKLGRYWGLPEEIIAVIVNHHAPSASAEVPLINMVNIKEKILAEFCVVKHKEEAMTEQDWLVLGIDPDKAEEIHINIAEVSAQAFEFAGAF
jgi:HD-like signal output (HDOD) protein